MDKSQHKAFLQDLTAALSNVQGENKKFQEETYNNFIKEYNNRQTDQSKKIEGIPMDLANLPASIDAIERMYNIDLDFVSRFESALFSMGDDMSLPAGIDASHIQEFQRKYQEVKMKYEKYQESNDIKNF